jgi:hypothetical protein
MSRRRLVAAEDENILTSTIGKSSDGKCKKSVTGFSISDSKSKVPEDLNIPMAIIRPISVGRISITTLKPSFAPL